MRTLITIEPGQRHLVADVAICECSHIAEFHVITMLA